MDEIGGDIGALLQILRDDGPHRDPKLIDLAVDALGSMSDPAVTGKLSAMVRRRNGRGRFMAARALAKRGDAGVAALLDLLRNSASGDHSVANLAFGALAWQSDMQPEISWLSAPDPSWLPALSFLLESEPQMSLPDHPWLGSDADQMIYSWSSHGDDLVRALVQIGSPSVESLIELTLSASPFARLAAIYALGKIGDRRAADALLNCIDDGYEINLHTIGEQAIDSLGLLRQPDAIPYLLPLLNDTARRTRAIWALETIGDSSTLNAVLAALDASDASAYQYISAYENLGGDSDIAHILPYLDATNADGDPDECAQCPAAEALARLGHPDALRFLLERIAFGDNNFDHTFTVVNGLVHVGAAAVEPLLEYVRQNREGPINNALEILDQLDDPRVAPLAIELMESLPSELDINDHSVVHVGRLFGLARILGKVGDSRAVEPLLRFLRLKPAWVFRPIPEALGKIGDPRAIVPLTQDIVPDSDDRANPAVVDALRSFGDAAVPALLNLLETGDIRQPFAAIWTLSTMGKGNSSIADALRRVVHDHYEDPRNRQAARLVLAGRV